MFEKVNPSHPDKIADRIAGAIVDIAYTKEEFPKVAVEVLIGHGECNIIIETDVKFTQTEIFSVVQRIAGDNIKTNLKIVPQDKHLADNQSGSIKCGDNGIFKGVPITYEQRTLTRIVKEIYQVHPTDGKYIIDFDNDSIIGCQSNMEPLNLYNFLLIYAKNVKANPLGYWTGGTDIDSGATNRKLGSDMGDSVTGGGINGKDLSKADVSVNIYLHLMAQKYNRVHTAICAIGDDNVTVIMGEDNIQTNVPFSLIVEEAKKYIDSIGGFEKLAEYGLIR